MMEMIESRVFIRLREMVESKGPMKMREMAKLIELVRSVRWRKKDKDDENGIDHW